MKQLNSLILSTLCLLLAASLSAQTRYVDEVFDAVDVQYNIPYAQNISVLTTANGDPDTIALFMDIYQPVGDDVTERPVVLYFPTGSFLPQYFNGQVTGGRLDSTIVEISTRLAKRGYVVAVVSYRQGWLPLAEDANTRRGTLLQAAYRGIQDGRSAVRFLRSTIEDETNPNPYGLDGSRFVAWGQGTGGYISYGMATLDRYEEISSLEKFINTETALPYVLEAVDGDPYGLSTAVLALPNHEGFDSDIHMAVNMGGACGDISWIESPEVSPIEQPVMMGFHSPTDPFAPFIEGPVIVPTTEEFVVNVSGTHSTIEQVNDLGINALIDYVLDDPSPLDLYVSALEGANIDLTALGQGPTNIGEPHAYPFLPEDFAVFDSSPWEWWGKPQLDLVIPAVNALTGANLNADTLHQDGLLTNPGMSKEKALLYIDTIMNYFYPRACQGLQLDCAIVNTEDLLEQEVVQLSAAPNPSTDFIQLNCNEDLRMQRIEVYGINGSLMRTVNNIDHFQYTLRKDNLPPGTYLIKAVFEEGVAVQKVIFR